MLRTIKSMPLELLQFFPIIFLSKQLNAPMDDEITVIWCHSNCINYCSFRYFNCTNLFVNFTNCTFDVLNLFNIFHLKEILVFFIRLFLVIRLIIFNDILDKIMKILIILEILKLDFLLLQRNFFL